MKNKNNLYKGALLSLIALSSSLSFAMSGDFPYAKNLPPLPSKDIAKILIKGNPNLNNQDNNGQTILMLSSINNDKEMVELLIANGADLDIKDKNGKTALDLASSEEIKKLIQDAIAKK